MGIVTCCNISHNGKMAVTGSDLDHSVKVWDVASGEVIAETKGWSDIVNTITIV